MVTLAVLRATWFSPQPEVEFVFYILKRGYGDLIILEEKNTDKHYRIEYDNHYKRVEDVVKEIIEELRTREFDNQVVRVQDQEIDWTYYYPIIQEISELIDHGITSFELQGNPDKYANAVAERERDPATIVILMASEIAAEFQFILNKEKLS